MLSADVVAAADAHRAACVLRDAAGAAYDAACNAEQRDQAVVIAAWREYWAADQRCSAALSAFLKTLPRSQP